MNLKSLLPLSLRVSLLSAVLAGCSPSSGPQGSPQAGAPVQLATVSKVDIQTTSPDLAVKSWWALFDAWAQDRYNECLAADGRQSSIYKDAPAIATGEMLATLSQRRPCEKESYSRDIDSVNVETETRAVVLATVRITTPIPPGASLNVEERKAGERFRYVVEKTDGKWKLAMVYRNQGGRSDRSWEKVYETRDTPYVMSTIYLQ